MKKVKSESNEDTNSVKHIDKLKSENQLLLDNFKNAQEQIKQLETQIQRLRKYESMVNSTNS